MFDPTFANVGGDNIGVLLDNVAVTTAAIPEQSTCALMLTGPAGIGFMARRRTQR